MGGVYTYIVRVARTSDGDPSPAISTAAAATSKKKVLLLLLMYSAQ
jgi:hypothetical protein